jgi:choline-glycine betaine transporter
LGHLYISWSMLRFFRYRKNLLGLISSIFYPILGDRIHGPIGKAIDVLAVLTTIFGVATSLGLVDCMGGSFIGQVSKGRTINEFVLGVLIHLLGSLRFWGCQLAFSS